MSKPLLLLDVCCPNCQATLTRGEQVVLGAHVPEPPQEGEVRLSALFGDYTVQIRYEDRLPEGSPPAGGLVIQTGPEELLVAGYGIGCRFQARTPGLRHTGIQRVELGHFDDEHRWVHELWLNGDETGANNTARIPPFSRNVRLGAERPMILRVTVFRYE